MWAAIWDSGPGAASPARTIRNLGITQAGNTYLRWLLVECVHRLLRIDAPDSAIKRGGQKLCERGGKNAKKLAIVAVARKLAVLLHKLWVTQQRWEPLYGVHSVLAIA